MLTKYYTVAYKGLAILSIILCHAAGTFGQGRFVLFTPLGGIGVAIFLLLSANGLNESWNKPANAGGGITWWLKRFITVWIPYIIVQLIAYCPFHEFQLLPFLLDNSLLKPLYHNGWYLQYLFMWYVIFFSVRKVPVLNKHRVFVFSAISVVLFFTLREIKAEQSLSFLLGIILSERKEWQEKLFNVRYGLLFTAFGVVCLAIKQLPIVRSTPQIVMNFVQLGIKLPIGFGLMILCFVIVCRWKWIGTALGAVGIISYELYLIHGYVLAAVPASIVGVVMFVIVTAVLSILYYCILKRLRPVLLKALHVI